MSTGVMQSEYRIPKAKCRSFLDDLHRSGKLLTRGFELPADGIMISLQKHAPDKMPLSLDFSECRTDDESRHITVIWTIHEEAVVARLEESILRNGGVPVRGAILAPHEKA